MTDVVADAVDLCAPRWPIDAPPLRPSVNGLLTYAERPNVSTSTPVTTNGAAVTPRPAAWEAGFTFRGRTGSGLVEFINDESVAGASDEESNAPLYKLAAVGDLGDLVSYQPFLAIGALECGPLAEDVDLEVDALMNAALSDSVERQLWTGSALDENPSLTDGRGDKLAAGAGVTLVKAFALLDQALTHALHGALGMIHVTPYTLTMLQYTTSAVRWNADRWLSPNGHTIIAGSGYTGAAPRANVGDAATVAPDLLAEPPVNQWAYATGPVQVLLSPVVDVTPDRTTDTNRRSNRTRNIVERVAAAYFSPSAQFGVNIDLTP